VSRQLEENLGVEVEAVNMEWKSLLHQTRTGDFQLARLGACAVDLPLSFLENFKSTSPRNDMAWKSAEFDRLFEKASCGSTSRAEALAATGEAEEELMRGRPVLPLYWYTRGYYKAPVLQGLEVQLEDYHPIKYMWWADTQTPPTPMPMPELVVEGGR
jgi:oligopeptide transport system substrate-binding protein